MLDKQKTYLILNYDTSPVIVSTRYENRIVPAGNDETPTSLPMSIDDISFINSTTKVFKIGKLFFEPEFESEIYEELRIRDWRDILRNQDIYDIILNPTMEKLERILAIDDQMYFDRIYGAYIGLKNDGVNVSTNVENIIKARYAELMKHKRKTEIKIRPKEDTESVDPKVTELENQVAELRQLLSKLTQAQPVETPQKAEPKATETKPKTQRKSSSTKSSTAKKN